MKECCAEKRPWKVRPWMISLGLVVGAYGVLTWRLDGPAQPRPWAGSKARTDIAAIVAALGEYAIRNAQKYPETLQPLVTPDEKGKAFLETTVGRIPLDPWKRPYLYEPPGPGRARPRVWTLGRDGKPGGIGDDADVDSSRLRDDR